MDEARPVSQRDVTWADGIAPYCEYTNITDMWCDSSQQDKKKEEKLKEEKIILLILL